LYGMFDVTMTGDGDPERVQTIRTTPSLSSVLRVPPAVGRWFTDDEGVPGAGAVAVLSHGFWMRRFGGDSSVIGRAITLNGVPTNVIGVMPPAFVFPDARYEAWVPLQLTRATAADAFGYSGIV